MKILHINTYDSGGSAIAAIRLHKELLSQGYDSNFLFLYQSFYSIPNSFYYSDTKKKETNFFIRQFKKLKKKIYSKPTEASKNRNKLLNKSSGYEMFSFGTTDFDITTQRLYKEADIIHLNWVSGFLDYSFFEKNAKPVVWTLHDMNPFTGGCHYSSSCVKFKTECRNCPQLLNTINPDSSFIDQNYKIKMLYGQQIVIVTPSEWLRKLAASSRLFNHLKTYHIANCIDFSVFKPLDKIHCREILNIPIGDKVLLFVSDNYENKRKGFDLMIGALALLDNTGLTLVAIGGNNNKLQLLNKVLYLGSVLDERLLPVAYSATDAFVLPSREDNLPNVMLESLACGTPVISFQVGGMTEVIKEGLNGILVKETTSTSLSYAISDFFEGKFNFNSNKIRENAELMFKSSIQADKYLEVYKKTLK